MTILVLSALVAGLAVYYRYQQGRRTLALWGAEYASLLRNARQVEILRLEAAEEGSDSIAAPRGGAAQGVAARRDVSRVPDFVYIRNAFLNDAYFRWEADTSTCEPRWAYVLTFRDGERIATLWIDDRCDVVLLEETDQLAAMNPALLKSVRRFLKQHTTATAPGESPREDRPAEGA